MFEIPLTAFHTPGFDAMYHFWSFQFKEFINGVKKKLNNFRPPVWVSCSSLWPEWLNINNMITKRNDQVKLCILSYIGMESRYVITDVEKFQYWPPAGAAPSPLSPEVPLNKQNIIHTAPKRHKQIKLSAIPYFWTMNSLVTSGFSYLDQLLGIPYPISP